MGDEDDLEKSYNLPTKSAQNVGCAFSLFDILILQRKGVIKNARLDRRFSSIFRLYRAESY